MINSQWQSLGSGINQTSGVVAGVED